MPTYKIHPTIGFARVGNSPEFFIGPERRHQPPNPTGGFKDLLCRVKRQAARFRVFEYPDTPGASPVELDLAASGATLTWKVRLETAVERTVTGVGGSTEIRRTSNDIFLGELRTDASGRLVVLGGLGWMSLPSSLLGPDDTTDGYVEATLIIGDRKVPVAPAWVVVAGPKFAPQLDYVVTLWDVAENRIHGSAPLSGPVSYTEHIYPILKRAQDIQWVSQGASGHHTWDLANVSTLPREQIFEALRVPIGVTAPPDMDPLTVPTRTMPGLVNLSLTRLQYLRMHAFSTGSFVSDWAGEPVPSAGPPTPSELDRAALEACCGGSFSPGIEVDATILIPTIYEPAEPLRLKPTGSGGLAPGALRGMLESPWATDYMLGCARYWPIAAPNQVLKGPPGSEVYERWFAGSVSTTTPAQILDWHELGFVTRDDATGKYVVKDCVPPRLPRFELEILRLLQTSILRIIQIADPSPIDIIRGIRTFVSRVTAKEPEVRAAADDLSRLAAELEELDAPQLRVRLVDLKAQLARLETAVVLVEERLKARRS